ncbi:MAG: hypothetical protein ACXVA9_13860 [Bdellovibrionales bacterium]
MLARLVILALISACSLSHAQTSCLNSRDAIEVLNTFRFSSSDPSNPVDFCAANSFARNLLEALLFLKSLHWDRTDGGEFSRGIIKSEPYAFLKQRVSRFVISSENSTQCSGKAGARNAGPLGVYICPLIAKWTPFELAAVMMHEARHSDPDYDNFAHVDCKTGRVNRGAGNCDPSYEFAGAYAVGAEFAVRVAGDTTLPMDVRDEARRQALDDFYRKFYAAPFGIRLGVVLQDDVGALTFFDGSRSFDYPLHVNLKTQVLAAQNQTLTIADSSLGRTVGVISPGAYISFSDSLSRFYANSLTAQERPQVLDFYFGASYSCLLFVSQLRCMDTSGNLIQNLDLGPVHARGFLSLGRSSNENAAVYIVGDDGQAYLLPDQTMALASLRTDDLLKTASASTVVSLSVLNGDRVGLLSDGSVHLYSDALKAWSRVPGLSGRKFVKQVGNIWWSEKLAALKSVAGS